MKYLIYSLLFVVFFVSCKKSTDATLQLSEFTEMQVTTVNDYNNYYILKTKLNINADENITEHGFVYSYSHPVFNDIFSDSLRILYTFHGSGAQGQYFEDTIFHLGLPLDYAIKPYASNAGRISFGSEIKLSSSGTNNQKIAAPAFLNGAVNSFALSNSETAIAGGGSGNRLYGKLDGNTLQFSATADTLPLDFANELCASFTLGNYGYVVGGRLDDDVSEQVFRYDFAGNSWVKMQNFPGGARMAAIAAVVDNKAYVGFGTNNTSNFADWWEYDVQNDTWNEIKINETNIKGRNGASCFVIGKNVYVIGGNTSPSLVNNLHATNFWKFNSQEKSWQVLPDCPFNSGRCFGFTNHNEGYMGFGNIAQKNNLVVGYNETNQKWFGYYDGNNGNLVSSSKAFSLELKGKYFVANFETNELMRIK